ncbi:T9SS sorting signal type C domain-containing protein [Cognatitamlana onchidii]|uniref:T9SS sorting signal type C domain-containing protein n=1 Tax=Cognatitamlana onchidii TaxID=2562860 RepID=UPI0010A68D21|nr:T9SS sorting signal type C domain-containing protein [Algibacter onchidii]
MVKSAILYVLLLLTYSYGYGQTILNSGEIAITGFNCDDTGGLINTENEFTFVLLRDIESGTTIRFTDNGWLSSGGFRANEGVITWQANSNLPCGTEVNISTGVVNFFFFTFPFYNASAGSIDSSNFANFELSTNGDQILAYQGTSLAPSFLYAINFNGTNWSANAVNNATSAIPAGLINNTDALHINEIDNAEYDCTATSGISNTLLGITNASNWIRNNNARFSPLGGCSFSCNGCSSAVIWDGSWSGTPDLTTEVLFKSDYSTSSGNVQCCSVIVNTGATLTINNGSFIEIENNTSINGNLIVETSGNFVQNGVGASAGTFTGTATLNKTTPLKDEWYYYTYWGSPVVGETIGNVFPNVLFDWRYSFNAANFVDTDGDDIDDDGNDWEIAGAGDTMTPGVGFAVAGERSSSGAYPRADNISFTGTFNTGDISVPITYGAGNPNIRWNFIGNPYPSAIDFVAFHLANASVLEGVAYFWDQGTPPASGSLSGDDYAVFTVGTGGVGARGDTGAKPNGFVASGQGFFIPARTSLTSPSGHSATFTNAMRSADPTSNGQFFKTSTTKTLKTTAINPLENKLWVNLTSNNGVFNQILIGYVENATDAFDGMSYDAPKLLTFNYATAFYSKIDNDNTKYVIQGKNINSINEDEVIKLGLITNIEQETVYKFSIDNIEGEFLSSNAIYLKDNLLSIIHNLNDSDYSFTSEVGEFNDRFEIVFSEKALSIDDKLSQNNSLRIIELNDGFVQFKTSEQLLIKKVSIYDVLGRQLYNLKGNKSTETYMLSNLSNATYIVKVQLSNGSVLTKKIIKN